MSDNRFENDAMDFFTAGKEARRVHGGDKPEELENRSSGTRSYGPIKRSGKSGRDSRRNDRAHEDVTDETGEFEAVEEIDEVEADLPGDEPAFEQDVPAETPAAPEPEEDPVDAEPEDPELELMSIPSPEVDEILREQQGEAAPAETPAAPEEPELVLIPKTDFKANFRADRARKSDDMDDLAAMLMAGAVFLDDAPAAQSAEGTGAAAPAEEDPSMAALRAALMGSDDTLTAQEEALFNRLDAQQTQPKQPEQAAPAAPAAAPVPEKPQSAAPQPKQQPKSAKQSKKQQKKQPKQAKAPEKAAQPEEKPVKAPEKKPAEVKAPKQEKPAAKAKKTPEPKKQPEPKKKQPEPQKKKRRGGLIAAIAAAALCLVVAGSAFVVSQRDTIFPKVTMQGEDLSGMTVQEATAAVKNAGWDGSNGTILKVLLPGELEMDVRGRDIGWSATAEETAQAAWNYGRDGNFFSNLVTFVRSAMSGHEISEDLLPEMDTSILHKQVKRSVDKANEAMSDGNLEVDLEAKLLRVIKGGDLFAVETEDVYNRILSALDQHEPTLNCVKKVDADSKVKDVDMKALHDEVCGEPENASYDPEKKEVVDGKPGIEFDIDEAQKLWSQAKAGDVVKIPITLTEPDFRKEDVKELFADKLASKTTSLSGSSAARITNITLAAEKINGVILDPGQSFSYNDTVGQRTTARGFREAGAYANGEVVQEVGGGICQVSSTLYYSALMSNLKITARTAHYFAVGYIEPGLDATVSWGAPDFRFENSRTFPIKIVATVTGNNVTVEIWGTDVDHSTVKMDSTTSGMTTTTFRNVYDKDGQLLSRTQEAVSTYHTHEETRPTQAPAPARTPTPTRTPTPAPTPTPAAPTPTPAAPTETPVDPSPEQPDVDTLDDTIVG